jgi:hypothetical protein
MNCDSTKNTIDIGMRRMTPFAISCDWGRGYWLQVCAVSRISCDWGRAGPTIIGVPAYATLCDGRRLANFICITSRARCGFFGGREQAAIAAGGAATR